MENDRFKKKIRHVAGVSIVILISYLLLPLSVCIRSFCVGFLDGYHSAEEGAGGMAELFFSIAAAAVGIAAVVNALRLLLDMRKGETPFTRKNGRRIGRTGIMLMVLEPLFLLSGLFSGGEFPEIHGISFAAGLIMCNVALLFEYGAHLQQESDETL